MNEQKSGTEEPPAKRMRRTYSYNHRKWWKCWGISKCWWRWDVLQEDFIRIYSMKYRAPFSAIPVYIFRKILTYVDFDECHQLKRQKVYAQERKERWWEDLDIPDWLWERKEMQRAFIEIYRMKYRAPFSAIPTSAFREILTYYDPLEKLIIS
jgi:hypothetical protein